MLQTLEDSMTSPDDGFHGDRFPCMETRRMDEGMRYYENGFDSTHLKIKKVMNIVKRRSMFSVFVSLNILFSLLLLLPSSVLSS